MKKTLLICFFSIIVLRLLPQTFTDQTSQAGIQVQTALGDVVVWIDYNNDGWLDFFGGTEQETFLYRNNGDGTFSDMTSTSGLGSIIPRGVSAGDFDNDGFTDLVVTSFSTSEPVVIYRNLSGNGFDEWFSTGFNAHRAVCLDYNADGHLDLLTASSSGFIRLFRNNGEGNFTEMTGILEFNPNSGGTPAACDMNNDGLQDLYFGSGSTTKTNRLYLNNAGQNFSDITFPAGVSDFRNTVAVCWGDYDSDGFMDLYFGNIGANRNVLFHNNGNGTFTDLTMSAGVADAGDARTCAWADINNDGLIDLFTTNHVNPNRLFLNNGNGSFSNIAAQAGIASPQDGFGMSWGDYDRDGDLDLVMAGHSFVRLFRNELNTGNFINLTLHGNYDNRSAIGARVWLYQGGYNQIREIFGGRGAVSQDALSVHFGLGEVSIVDSIIVQWPSGQLQKLFETASNQFINIEQDGNIPPIRFKLLSPLPDSIYSDQQIPFVWQSSEDPDKGNTIQYFLSIQTPIKDTVIETLTDTVCIVNMSPWMVSDSASWFVVASDGENQTKSWNTNHLQYSIQSSIESRFLPKLNQLIIDHVWFSTQTDMINISVTNQDGEGVFSYAAYDIQGKLIHMWPSSKIYQGNNTILLSTNSFEPQNIMILVITMNNGFRYARPVIW
jgi:hypothetical protein